MIRTALLRSFLGAAAMLAASVAMAAPQPVKIGIGFGIGFLPTYLLEQLQLLEKHAKAASLDVSASYQRISGSAAMQDAVISGSVDFGAYGVPAMLLAWEKARGTPNQIVGVAGVNASPLVLITNQADVKSLAEFKPTDRIAMPALVSPQMYVLQIAAEKAFGDKQYDRLKPQVVALPHPEALNSLLSGKTEITAYFSSPPYTQLALRNPAIHRVLSSEEVFGGRASFLVMATTKRAADANPKLAEALVAALAEADRIIRTEPRRAAEIYLKIEPVKGLDVDTVEGILREQAEDFGVEVHGVKAYADFMARVGQLKRPPARWDEVFLSPIHGTASD